MQQPNNPQTKIIVLKKGEDLMKLLEEYATQHALKCAWINVIGGAFNVTIGYYDPVLRQYIWKEFNEPLEIIGLQGNLAFIDSKPFWHIHGVFSRRDYSVIGGHVKNCIIGLTGEVSLTLVDNKFVRECDNETGLKLLCPAEES